MDKRQELITQTAARLAEIKTFDQMKSSMEEIYALMGGIFQSFVDVFRNFVENMDGVSDEELQAKALLFQDESFLMPPEVMAQMERLDNLVSDPAFLDAYTEELEKRFEGSMEQIDPLTEKLMDKLMSGSMGQAFNGMVEGVEDAMGGMAEAMGDLAGGMAGNMEDEEPQPEFVFDFNNIATPRMMYELYSSSTWEDFDQEHLVDEMEQQLQNDVWELEGITDANYGGPKDAALESITEIRTRIEVYESELDKELTRLGNISDKVDEAAALKKEIVSKVSMKVREIKHYLAKL